MGFAHQPLPSQVPGLRVGLCAPAESPEGPEAGGTEAPLSHTDAGRPRRHLPESSGGASLGWGGGRSRGEALAAGREGPGPERWVGGGPGAEAGPRCGSGGGPAPRALAPGGAVALAALERAEGPSLRAPGGRGLAAGGASSGSALRFRFPPFLRLIPRPEGAGAERRTDPPTVTPVCLATRAPIPPRTPPTKAVSVCACMDIAPQGEKLAFIRFEVGPWGEGETLPWGRGDSRGRAIRNAQALARGMPFCFRPHGVNLPGPRPRLLPLPEFSIAAREQLRGHADFTTLKPCILVLFCFVLLSHI